MKKLLLLLVLGLSMIYFATSLKLRRVYTSDKDEDKDKDKGNDQLISKNQANVITNTVVGGFGNDKKPDKRVEKIFDSIKDQVVRKLGAGNGTFKLLSYSTQVVAGINFHITFLLGKQKYLAKIFQPLPYTKKQNQLLHVAKA